MSEKATQWLGLMDHFHLPHQIMTKRNSTGIWKSGRNSASQKQNGTKTTSRKQATMRKRRLFTWKKMRKWIQTNSNIWSTSLHETKLTRNPRRNPLAKRTTESRWKEIGYWGTITGHSLKIWWSDDFQKSFLMVDVIEITLKRGFTIGAIMNYEKNWEKMSS